MGVFAAMVPEIQPSYLWPVLVTLLIYCNSAGSVCLVGPSYVQQLVVRNATIRNIMNNTLVEMTKNATNSVLAVSNMDLQQTLKTSFNLTAANLLDAASQGKLLLIDWTLETKGKASNASAVLGIPLADYINQVFTNVVQDRLYEIANNYSFSLGIFKPAIIKFDFTGLNSTLFGYSAAVLDKNCVANRAYVWDMETDLVGVRGLSNYKSPQFANFTTMVERAFDEFYRLRVSAFVNDFVRVIVTDVYAGYLVEASFRMEVYFLNGSFTNDYVERTTLDNLDLLPTLHFWDGGYETTFAIESSVFDSSVIASYGRSDKPTTTTSTASTVGVSSSAVADRTSTTSTSTRISTSLVTNVPTASQTSVSTSTTVATTSTILPTASMPPSTPATYPSSASTPSRNNATTSIASANLTTINALANANSSVNETSSSTVSNVISAITQLLGDTNSTITPAVVIEQSTETLPEIPDEVTGTTAVDSAVFSSNTAASIASINSTTLKASTEQSSFTQLTTQLSNNTDQTTIPARSVSPTTPSNTTTIQYTTPAAMQSNVTSRLSSKSSNNTNAITFDPDPFFQPNEKVPVVTKLYNDGFLLKRQMGAVSSLLQEATFFTITIPTAIGLIFLVFGCLFLWQIDCLGKSVTTHQKLMT